MIAKQKNGVEAWINGYSKASQKIYRIGYDLFIRYLESEVKGKWNDERIIKERTKDLKEENYEFEDLVVNFYFWLKEAKPNLSDNSRQTYVKAIRSFFTHIRKDLKFTRTQKAKILKKPKLKFRYYEFTLEDVRKMHTVSKPIERYVLSVGISLGLRASDFLALKQNVFIEGLDKKVPISLGEINTQKENVVAHCFLSYDAKDASKAWLEVLKSKGKYDPNARMIGITKVELNNIIKNLVKRGNVPIGDKDVRFHSLRQFLITRFEMAKVSENRWKQIVGKEIPEKAYIGSLLLKDDFQSVLEYITINMLHTKDALILKEINERLIGLEAENSKLREVVRDLIEANVNQKHVAKVAIDFLAEGYEALQKEKEQRKT